MGKRRNSSLGIVSAVNGPAGVSPFDEADRERARAAVIGALGATRRVRAGRCPTTGGLRYEDVPDHAVRLAAASTLLAYAVGKPTSTAVVAHVSARGGESESPAEFFTRTLQEPGAIESLRETLAEIEKCRVNTAAPIDIEARPSLPPESDVSQPPLPPGDGAAGEG